jgi:hypothetical protein
MTDREGIWRDEQQLSLRDLERAVSSPALDGQLDEMTDNASGEEAAFGHGPEAATYDPHATDPDRPYRPSTTGRNGPH